MTNTITFKTAYEKTRHHAFAQGFRCVDIDDDCFIVSDRGTSLVQVTYDNYSPSWKFTSAVTLGKGEDVRFKSYAEVRAYLTGVMQARVPATLS